MCLFFFYCLLCTVDDDFLRDPEPVELIFEPGERRQCTNVTIVDDMVVESPPMENFIVVIETVRPVIDPGLISPRPTATITILDDDGSLRDIAASIEFKNKKSIEISRN